MGIRALVSFDRAEGGSGSRAVRSRSMRSPGSGCQFEGDFVDQGEVSEVVFAVSARQHRLGVRGEGHGQYVQL